MDNRQKLYLNLLYSKCINIERTKEDCMISELFYTIGETILLEVEEVEDVKYCGNEKEMILIAKKGEKVKVSF